MSIRPRLCASVVLVCTIGAAVVACNRKSPTSPGGPGGPGPRAAFVSLQLSAPARISPGESAQLIAEAIRADGSAQNVSTQSVWSSSNRSAVQVSALGLVTTAGRGESVVQARHEGRVAQAQIFVMPADTFRLAGSINEGGVGVGGVEVRVLEGVGQSLVNISSDGGSYALYGVSGSVRIKLSKAGYLDAVQDVEVTANRSQNFDLRPERPRADYRGTYTLTITAQPGCQAVYGPFPEAARRREYTADVAQDGPRVTVTLSGADFSLTGGRGNSFAGWIDISNTLTFTISHQNTYGYGPWYFGPPDIAEKIDGTTLIVMGTVSVREGLLSGQMGGALLVGDRSSYPFGPPYRSICSGVHGFEMVRRS